MKPAKDSTEVIKFMALFQKLRDWIDDDPFGLEELAADDEALKRLCNNLGFAATFLSMNEKRQRELFSAPVDPKFIEAWRTYEARYASLISGIFLSDIGLDLRSSPIENKSEADFLWETADDDAKDQAKAIEGAIDFANDQATDDWRDFPDGFSESIEEGTSAWKRLAKETGFDLRGIFRRRELVPFVLIPRHVSQQHGDAEKLSLFTHLRQAHDAFIFGVPFAALALMRSILETTLRVHYHANGDDLKQMIENCYHLPRDASKPALHRLRTLTNAILHFNSENARLPADFERDLLSLLFVLRALIEGAPIKSIGTGLSPK
jgi:hypothetical protein